MSTCQAIKAFANSDVLPECLRPATVAVDITVKDKRHTILTCQPCAGMFTIRRALKATVTPLETTSTTQAGE